MRLSLLPFLLLWVLLWRGPVESQKVSRNRKSLSLQQWIMGSCAMTLINLVLAPTFVQETGISNVYWAPTSFWRRHTATPQNPSYP